MSIKNRLKKLGGLLFFLLIAVAASAQEPINSEAVERKVETLNYRLENAYTPQEIFWIGEEFFRMGKYEEAKKAFLKRKSDKRNLLGAATSARLSGKNSEAIRYYDELIALDPGINEAYFGRALSYRDIEEYNRAINDFKKYLSREKNEYAYAGLGDLYILTGKNSDAKYILEEGNSYFPDSKLIKKLLTRAYSK